MEHKTPRTGPMTFANMTETEAKEMEKRERNKRYTPAQIRQHWKALRMRGLRQKPNRLRSLDRGR